MSKISFKIGKNKVDFDIDDRLTFIGGDSATGRSLVVDMFYDIMKNPELIEITGISPYKIKVCKNEESVYSILNQDKALIVIDRYDIYSKETKQLIRNEMEKENNTWIIMTRRPDFVFKHNIGYSRRSFKKIKIEVLSENENLLTLELD